ncbi:hypothetical protein ACH9EU_01865 [Kocuria sp. M1R5S2]|uniref:hypothetical protein n=1 Tax=Kocuria rhizosphaerae TaxID=3376285 RepID=UPI0037BCA8D0
MGLARGAGSWGSRALRCAWATGPARTRRHRKKANCSPAPRPSSSSASSGLPDRQGLDHALRSGFSADVRFAHQTGLLEEVSHDARIMAVDGHEVAVAVLADGWSGDEDSTPWFQEAGRTVEGFVRRSAG